MAEMSTDAVWLDVLPSMDGFFPALKKGIDKGGDKEAVSFGKRFGKAALAGMAVVGTGAALATKAILNVGETFADMESQIAASTGASGKELEYLVSVSEKVGGKVPASFEEIGVAVAAVQSSLGGFGDMTEEQLAEATAHAQNFAQAFEIDITRASQVAGQMVKTGMAKDATEAFDLLTAAAQRVPAAVREDIVDAVDEYGPFFSQMGIEGEKAMGLLVAASEKGMFGIDKTGDALKEFSIRATDMSEASGDAYKALGLNQERMSAALLKGGDEGAKAFDQIVGALGKMKDPLAQSQAALALFGTPLEDLGTAEIPQFIDQLKSGTDAMEGYGGAADELGQNLIGPREQFEILKNELMVELKPVADDLFAVLKDGMQWVMDVGVPAVKNFIDEFKNGTGEGGEFRDALEGVWDALKGAFGFIADNWQIIAGLAAIILGVVAAIKIWTIVQAALNLVMMMNPIGLIIIAIVALVAAFVLLWNNSEGFRNFFIGMWEAIKGAVKAVLDWFTGTLLPGIRGVWEAIVNAFIAVRDKFVEIVNKIVHTVLLFVAKVKMHFLQMYANIFNTVQTIRDKVTEVFGKIRDKVVEIVTGIRDTVVNRFTALRDRVMNVVNKFRDKIKSAFDKIKDGIVKVANGIRDTAGGIFDKISDLAKKPIKFVIETVLNNGLIKGANTVAKVVGLGANWIPRIPLPKGFAGGGWTGPGSKYQPAGVVHADEFVIQKSMRGMFERKFPGYLQHINQHGTLPGYASGGQVAPVGGKGNRHVSGYPWATWAGDFPQPMGTPIAAWKNGIIALVRHLTTSYGQHVRINHDDGTSSLYAHMSKILVSVGQRVLAGQEIGKVGSTGNSTGPHLHFETMGGPYSAKGKGGLLDLFKGFPNPVSWLTDLIGGALGKSPGGGMLGEIVGKVPGMLADAVKDKISIFDNGGWLKPGHLAYNGLSKPEPIFTPGQWDKLSAGGGDFEVRVFIGDRELTDIVDTQIVRSVADTRRMALQTARSGRTRS